MEVLAAAAVHAAARDAQGESGRTFTVAPNTDELRAVVIPYSTVAAHGGDWQKVHSVEYMDELIAQQEMGSNYGIRLRQQLIVDGIEIGVNQIVIDKSDEERNMRTMTDMAVWQQISPGCHRYIN